jgi:hypothetical protein
MCYGDMSKITGQRSQDRTNLAGFRHGLVLGVLLHLLPSVHVHGCKVRIYSMSVCVPGGGVQSSVKAEQRLCSVLLDNSRAACVTTGQPRPHVVCRNSERHMCDYIAHTTGGTRQAGRACMQCLTCRECTVWTGLSLYCTDLALFFYSTEYTALSP